MEIVTISVLLVEDRIGAEMFRVYNKLLARTQTQ